MAPCYSIPGYIFGTRRVVGLAPDKGVTGGVVEVIETCCSDVSQSLNI